MLGIFFTIHLAASRPTLGHWQRGGLSHPMLITLGHPEPRNEFTPLSLTERTVGFELGIFRFWVQRYNPLRYSPVYWLVIGVFMMQENTYGVWVRTFYRFWGEWLSGLRRYISNWKFPGLNPTGLFVGFWNPTSLRDTRWPTGQSCNIEIIHPKMNCV